jgi:hypothetical protein
VEIAHSNKKLDEPYSLEEYEKHVWWDAMETCSKIVVESMIDSRTASSGTVVEYNDRVDGFPWGEGANLNVTLASIFFQK